MNFLRLVLRFTIISVKRSMKSVLPLIFCLLLTAAAGNIFLSDSDKIMEPIEIAVITAENDPIAVSLIDSVVNARFKSLAQIKLCENESQTKTCAAVITLPNGFWRSLITGENLSPVLEIRVTSPFEGLWVRQLADSAARLLTRAQSAVSGLYAAMLADGFSEEEAGKAVFACDMAMLNDYLTRRGRFQSVELSATGSVSAINYYLCSGASFSLFSLVFLFFKPLSDIKSFGRLCLKENLCFISAAISSLIFSVMLVFPSVFLLCGDFHSVFSAEMLLAAAFFAALMLFCAAFLPNVPSCAAFCFGGALVQAIFGGAIIPEAMLPAAFSPLYRILPLSLIRRLFAETAFSAGFENTLSLAVWCILLAALSAVCWQKAGAKK